MVRVRKVWADGMVEFIADGTTTLLATLRERADDSYMWHDADTLEVLSPDLQATLRSAWLGYCLTD